MGSVVDGYSVLWVGRKSSKVVLYGVYTFDLQPSGPLAVLDVLVYSRLPCPLPVAIYVWVSQTADMKETETTIRLYMALVANFCSLFFQKTTPFFLEEPAPVEDISSHGVVLEVAKHDRNFPPGEVKNARIGQLVLSTLGGHESGGKGVEYGSLSNRPRAGYMYTVRATHFHEKVVFGLTRETL